MKYSLYCFAPDGEYVKEGDFESIDAAWNRSNEMGSRWIFYPIHIVAEDKVIVATCDELNHFIGGSLECLSQSLKTTDQEDLCDSLNDGYIPHIEIIGENEEIKWETFKRDNWTNDEVIDMLKGFLLMPTKDWHTIHNEALDEAISSFYDFKRPIEESGAMARTEDGEIVHVGPILPR